MKKNDMKPMIIINGKPLEEISSLVKVREIKNARRVSIVNGRIIIDGVSCDDFTNGLEDKQHIKIEIHGDVQFLESKGAEDVTVNGKVNMVKTMSGDVHCNTIEGNVSTMSGDVYCGNIAGDVSTMSGDVFQKGGSK